MGTQQKLLEKERLWGFRRALGVAVVSSIGIHGVQSTNANCAKLGCPFLHKEVIQPRAEL